VPSSFFTAPKLSAQPTPQALLGRPLYRRLPEVVGNQIGDLAVPGSFSDWSAQLLDDGDGGENHQNHPPEVPDRPTPLLLLGPLVSHHPEATRIPNV